MTDAEIFLFGLFFKGAIIVWGALAFTLLLIGIIHMGGLDWILRDKDDD